ncbi:MAG: CPBP family intramembrane metalloprotease, partial [Desulfobulbaceae bacterium]|nr:CPBP family intramembrane metalloprotease [Desulfobulbaceae bacterium]
MVIERAVLSAAKRRDVAFNIKKYGMVPYVVPFILYLLFSNLAAYYDALYPWLYIASVIMVSGATIYLLSGRSLLQPHKNILIGVAFGIGGIIVWILLSQSNLEEAVISFLPAWLQPNQRLGFNPFETISNPFFRWVFILVRVVGLVLLVPVVEELFWRGFLLRWVISANWEEQPIGVFTLRSFLWVVLLFTTAHPEWFAAATYCILL